MAYLVALVRLRDAADGSKGNRCVATCAEHVGENVWNNEWTTRERLRMLRVIYRRAFGEEPGQWQWPEPA